MKNGEKKNNQNSAKDKWKNNKKENKIEKIKRLLGLDEKEETEEKEENEQNNTFKNTLDNLFLLIEIK